MPATTLEQAFKNSTQAITDAMQESVAVLLRMKTDSDPLAESMLAASKNISITKIGLRSAGRQAEELRQNLPGITPKDADPLSLQQEIPTLAGEAETPQI